MMLVTDCDENCLLRGNTDLLGVASHDPALLCTDPHVVVHWRRGHLLDDGKPCVAR